MRLEARASLQRDRELWKAIARGLDPHDAELAAHEALELAKSVTWRLYRQPLHQLERSPTAQALCAGV